MKFSMAAAVFFGMLCATTIVWYGHCAEISDNIHQTMYDHIDTQGPVVAEKRKEILRTISIADLFDDCFFGRDPMDRFKGWLEQ